MVYMPAQLPGVLWLFPSPGKTGRHLFAQGKGTRASCFINRIAAGKSQPRPPFPSSIPEAKAAQGAQGAWPWPHVSIRRLSMIYCCSEELFVLRGFPAGPAKVSAPFGRGRGGCQRGEGMGVQGREKQSPLGHSAAPWAQPEHPCFHQEPGAAGDELWECGMVWVGSSSPSHSINHSHIHLAPQGLQGWCQQPLPGL